MAQGQIMLPGIFCKEGFFRPYAMKLRSIRLHSCHFDGDHDEAVVSKSSDLFVFFTRNE